MPVRLISLRAFAVSCCVLGALPARAGAGPVPLTSALSLNTTTGAVVDDGMYPARHVADNDGATAWVANDKRLALRFPAARVIALEIVPGYQKSAALWRDNRRVLGVRVRLHPKAAGATAPVPTDWISFAVAAPDALPEPASARIELPLVFDGQVVGLDLEVTEATARTKSNDIVISTVAVQGFDAPPCSGEQRFTRAPTTSTPPADVFDVFVMPEKSGPCRASRVILGGAARQFEGTCTRTGKNGRTLRLVGTVVDVGMSTVSKSFTKSITVEPYGCGIAVIDGHVYERVLSQD